MTARPAKWKKLETADPTGSPEPGSQVILIRAPAGRDAQLIASALRRVAETRICTDIAEVAHCLPLAGAAIVAAEALDRAGLEQLREAITAQPSWSDVPLFIFTSTRSTVSENRRILDALASLGGNVTTLERPVHALTMVNAVQAGLRARARQYATRQLLADLELAVRQRDAFLAMLGHELRNPLGAIGNAVAVATRAAGPGGDESTGRQLRLIERQIHVLTRLVNDLLDVSRVTSGKVILQREPVDLVTLLDRLVAQMQTKARDELLHLSMSADPGPLRVMGDPVRLEQIFTNLIGNALKYTPPRGRIEVSVHRSGGEVAVRVADSGVGIAPDALPHVFELFAQADTTIDRSQGGMGVGLTLVQSLVQLHGGSTTAKSDGPGRGSVFTVTLPMTAVAGAAGTTLRAPDPAAAGRHVLLVEDNADNRATLRELLEFCGHRVDTAANGREGVELAVSLRPDIALVDIGLPEIDGYGVASRVRRELGPRIRLIALTGYGQPEDVQRAFAAGFDAHLSKPVDLDQLQTLLAP